MKKRVILALVFGCLAGHVSMAQVAVADFERLVKLHPNTAEDRKTMETVYNSLKSDGEAKVERVEKAMKQYEDAVQQAQNPALSDAARKKAEDDARGKFELVKIERDELRQLEDMHRMQLAERERKLLGRTTEAIREVVKKIAAAKKIKVVLPTAPILYFEPAVDITADILKAMGIDPDTKVPEDDFDLPAVGPGFN